MYSRELLGQLSTKCICQSAAKPCERKVQRLSVEIPLGDSSPKCETKPKYDYVYGENDIVYTLMKIKESCLHKQPLCN